MRIYKGFNILSISSNSLKTWSADLNFEDLKVFIGINNLDMVPEYIKEFEGYVIPAKEVVIISRIPSDKLIEMELINSKKAQICLSMADIGESILCGIDLYPKYTKEEKAKLTKAIEQKSSKLQRLGKYYQNITKYIEGVINKERSIIKPINRHISKSFYEHIKHAVSDLSKIKVINSETRKEFLRIEPEGALGFIDTDIQLTFPKDFAKSTISEYRILCDKYKQLVGELMDAFKLTTYQNTEIPDDTILQHFDHLKNNQQCETISDPVLESITDPIESYDEKQSEEVVFKKNSLVFHCVKKEYGIFLKISKSNQVHVFSHNYSHLNTMKQFMWMSYLMTIAEDDLVKDINGREIKEGMTLSFTNNGRATFLHSKLGFVYCVDSYGLYIKELANRAKIVDDEDEMLEPKIVLVNGKNIGAIIEEEGDKYNILMTDNKCNYFMKEQTKNIKLYEHTKITKSFEVRKWQTVNVVFEGGVVKGKVSAVIRRYVLISTDDKKLIWIAGEKSNFAIKEEPNAITEDIRTEEPNAEETNAEENIEELKVEENIEETKTEEFNIEERKEERTVEEAKKAKIQDSTFDFVQFPSKLRRSALVSIDGAPFVIDVVEHYTVIARPVLDGIIQKSTIEADVRKVRLMPVVEGCRVIVSAGQLTCRGTVVTHNGSTCVVNIDTILPTDPITIPESHLIRIFDPIFH